MLHNCYGINAEGHFTLGGADTVELAKKYGTPLYLLDENCVRENVRVYRDAMNAYMKKGSGIHYASKALSFKGIYGIIKDEGACVDVCSIGELFTALSAGFPPEKICLHGNNKSDEEIEYAVRSDVGEIVVDSFEELDALDSISGGLGKKQKIMLRVTPNIDPHTVKAITTGQLDSKFGTPIETGQAEKLVRLALAKTNVILMGYHCHCGSQVFEYQPFIDEVDALIGFSADIKSKTGYSPEIIDIGGGFGVRYTEEDPFVDIAEGIRRIAEEVRLACEKTGIPEPAILMEPGRSIVAAAGVTLYTVGSVKTIEGYRTYVSVDGGMTDNPRYALYGSKYEAIIADKAGAPKDTCVTIAGRCCESGDLIGENVKLQSAKRGDVLAVTVTGAYNYSMASNYNRVARPALVIIKDGTDRLGVRRESSEDLVKNDM